MHDRSKRTTTAHFLVGSPVYGPSVFWFERPKMAIGEVLTVTARCMSPASLPIRTSPCLSTAVATLILPLFTRLHTNTSDSIHHLLVECDLFGTSHPLSYNS